LEIKLTKRPKSPIIIDGFPGFGMVGTIATEFLIEHLKTEQIGKILFEEMPAIVAIHKRKVVEPFGIFYNKKYNVVIVHALGGSEGTEWKVSNSILEIAKMLNAKEIISLEGVGSTTEEDKSRTFYYTKNPAKQKKFDRLSIKPLNEGIIMGVTSALLLKVEKTPISCLFAETHSKMPDSKAAAELIKALDGYLGLNVDYKPLLKMAQDMEQKLRGIMQQGVAAQQQKDKKTMSYVG